VVAEEEFEVEVEELELEDEEEALAEEEDLARCLGSNMEATAAVARNERRTMEISLEFIY
jgi:hypothetical protein